MAVNEYNASLQVEPDRAQSLYGRGLAKLRTGDKNGGEADMAAALKLAPQVSADFVRIGMK